MPRTLLTCQLFALLMIFAHAGWSQTETYTVKEFRYIDQEYVDLARERINERLQNRVGTRFRGEASYDIPLLQRMLDERIVKQDEISLLQAMGVILGETMRNEYPLDWVRYADADGTSRALQMRHNAHFVFPITAISRRASVGLEVDVQGLYEKLLAPIREAYQR